MTAYIRFLRNGVPIPGGVRSGAHAGWSELLGFRVDGRTSASLNGNLQLATLTSVAGGSTSVFMQQSLGGFRAQAQPPRAAAGAANTYGGLTTVDQGIATLNAAHGGRQPARSSTAPIGKGTQVKIYLCPSDSSAYQPDNVVAEVDIAGAGDRAADLRLRIHGIRIVRYQRTPNGPVFKITNVSMASTYGRGVHQLSLDDIVIAYSRMTHAGAPASAPDISHLVRVRQVLPSFSPFEPAFRGGVRVA